MSKIELLDVWGNDLSVCDIARVSFNKKAKIIALNKMKS